MEQNTSQHIKELTSLRFLAALWVVAYDYWPHLGQQTPAFVSKGYLGVELFFVLSGFILSHVYLERFKNGRFNYGEFIWARLARVYPLHVAIIAGLAALIGVLAIAGVHAGDKLIVWSSLAAHLTLTHAWGLGQGGGWNDPSWSISAEWFAYVSFPIFALVACAFWTKPRLAIALTIITMIPLYIGFSAITGEALTNATVLWGALRIVPCFTLGCAIWLLWRSGAVRTQHVAAIWTLGAVTAIIVLSSLGAPDWSNVIACGVLIFGLGSLSRTGSTLLSNRVLVYLGEVSFAMYMVCIPWQLVFVQGVQKTMSIDPHAMPLPIWAALFLGVIPAAMVLHHLVERPARALMRKHAPRFRSPGLKALHDPI